MERDWRAFFNHKTGSRLKFRRTELGLRLPEVAKAIGVSEHEYAAYERGLSRPDSVVMNRLLSLFHIPVSFLFNGVPSTIEAAGFDHPKQARYDAPPALALRQRLGTAGEKIEDLEDLRALVRTAEAFGRKPA